jgi:hypothetical protein
MTLKERLADLPEPTMPEGLAARTMARIARLEDEPATPASRSPEGGVLGVGGTGRAWALALAGHAVGFGALVFVLLTGGSSASDLTSSRIGGLGSLAGIPETAPVTLALATGLLLYLAGLFAPLRRLD